MEPKSVLDANMSTTLKGKVQRPGEGWIPLSAKWLEKREMKMCCLQWPSTDWRGSKSMRQLCAGWTFCIPGRRAFLPLPPLRLLQLQVAQLPWGVWLSWCGHWKVAEVGAGQQGWGLKDGHVRRSSARSMGTMWLLEEGRCKISPLWQPDVLRVAPLLGGALPVLPGRRQEQHDFCSPSALCQRREQHLLHATRAGDALFLVTPAVECVSSPGSKEWKLGMCSSLHYTNYVINKVYPKQIKNRLPCQKELFKMKPAHLFRAENHFC